MIVKPSNRLLDDVVQDLEGDRGRRLDLAPDQRIGMRKLKRRVAISPKLSEAVEVLIGLTLLFCQAEAITVQTIPTAVAARHPSLGAESGGAGAQESWHGHQRAVQAAWWFRDA